MSQDFQDRFTTERLNRWVKLIGPIFYVLFAILMNIAHLVLIWRWRPTCSVHFVTRTRTFLLSFALYGQAVTFAMMLMPWEGWYLVLLIGWVLAVAVIAARAAYLHYLDSAPHDSHTRTSGPPAAPPGEPPAPIGSEGSAKPGAPTSGRMPLEVQSVRVSEAPNARAKGGGLRRTIAGVAGRAKDSLVVFESYIREGGRPPPPPPPPSGGPPPPPPSEPPPPLPAACAEAECSYSAASTSGRTDAAGAPAVSAYGAYTQPPVSSAY